MIKQIIIASIANLAIQNNLKWQQVSINILNVPHKSNIEIIEKVQTLSTIFLALELEYISLYVDNYILKGE